MGIILLALVIGCVPGAIAQSKGHSFVAWWLFGAALFIVALPMSIMLKPNSSAGASGATPSRPDAPTDFAFDKQGSRYALGHTMANPSYAIWDKASPGPPIFRFPYTEHGKSEADARYQELENAE